MDTATESVVKGIREAPCTLRALAREAGVAPSVLSRILSGERLATPAVALAVARALDRWGERCKRAATTIRKAHARGTP